ncbi:hypothetical protein [Mollivirus kamchatka]|nr:hypothetical protein [Mollivirus kamchatka]
MYCGQPEETESHEPTELFRVLLDGWQHGAEDDDGDRDEQVSREIKTLLTSGRCAVGDLEVENGCGLTCLCVAIEMDYFKTARVLVEAGADPVRCGAAASPVCMAADRTPVVCHIFLRWLLEHIQRTGRQHDAIAVLDGPPSVLCDICRGEDDSNTGSSLGLLLGYGLDPNAKDHNGLAPLHYVVQKGHVEFAQILFDRGADVNQVTSSRSHRTALHIAARQGDEAMVAFLLRSGAPVDALMYRDIDGEVHGSTALQLAEENRHPQAAKVLREWMYWSSPLLGA